MLPLLQCHPSLIGSSALPRTAFSSEIVYLLDTSFCSICYAFSYNLLFACVLFLSVSSSHWCSLFVSYQAVLHVDMHLSFLCPHAYTSSDILLPILHFSVATA